MTKKLRCNLKKKGLYVRDEIEDAVKTLNLSKNNFSEINKYHWKQVINKIEQTFISKLTHKSDINPYWKHLKGDVYCIGFVNDNAFEYLDKLIDRNEKVWFLVEDPAYKENKIWIYEGNIKSIKSIISECYGFEYYIMCKKFLWFLCENHHGCLMGAGERIIDKMKVLQMEISDAI